MHNTKRRGLRHRPRLLLLVVLLVHREERHHPARRQITTVKREGALARVHLFHGGKAIFS
jgi:hypothetical protein